MRHAISFIACAVGFCLAWAAHAQDYPNRPVRIIVPTQAGGVSDILSRTFANLVQSRTGATVVVENRTGANGVLAADYVAKSAPDGYTVYLGFQGTQSVLPHVDPKLPYDPGHDFAPVVLIAMGPAVLVVNPSFPARTVKELVELAKAKPGAYSYASAGFGTTHHLAAEMFKVAAGIDLTGVTYRGAAPANQDLIAGHVPIAFDNLGLAVNNIRNGGVRPLAITAKERSPLLPDVPTMAEVGYPNVVAQSWFALFVPAKTPRNAIDWLNRQANEVFADPALREQFQQQGLNLTLGSPEALGRHVVEETQRWGDVIRKAGITLPN